MAQSSTDLIAKTQQATQRDELAPFVDLLERKERVDQLQRLGINAQRFVRTLLTAVRRDANLRKAAVTSRAELLGAVMTLAQWNLDLAVPNECHLVAYAKRAKDPQTGQWHDSGKYTVTPMLGYKGLKKLTMRAARELQNPYRVLTASEVYTNDRYVARRGSQPTLEHERAIGERGELCLFYAVAVDSHGLLYFEELSVDDVKNHWQQFCKSKHNGPFATVKPKENPHGIKNFERYGIKTAFRLLVSRWLDMSPTLSDALSVDYQADGSVDYSDAIDITPVDDQEPDEDLEEQQPPAIEHQVQSTIEVPTSKTPEQVLEAANKKLAEKRNG